MNKLVSRNPILRFKLGRKIVKAQNSWGRDFGRINLGVNTPTIDYQIPSVEIPREQIESLPSVPVARVSYPYRGSIVRLGIQENPDISPSISLDSYLILGSTKGGQSKEADEALVQKMASEYLQQLAANETLKVEKQPRLTTVKKTRTVRQLNTPKFYGLTIGGKVLARGSNFNGLINDSLKQILLNAGFKNEDFNSVRSFLNALNNFFSKDGAGSIKADNMWGNQTLKAFDLALSKAAGLLSINKVPEIVKKPDLSTIPKNELPTINPNKIRNGNFNRSQIRDLIRNRGFNPYAYTGDLRKALRLYLNGLSNDTSLLDGTDLARFTLPFRKKGGQLPSRNIIERFKNRINKN